MRAIVAATTIATLLSACGSEAPPAQTKQPMPLVKKVCDNAQAALEALSSRGALDYDDQGSATITQDVWFQIPDGQREGIATALAHHAACASGQPMLEKEVTITGDTGMSLMRRTIDMSADPTALLADE